MKIKRLFKCNHSYGYDLEIIEENLVSLLTNLDYYDEESLALYLNKICSILGGVDSVTIRFSSDEQWLNLKFNNASQFEISNASFPLKEKKLDVEHAAAWLINHLKSEHYPKDTPLFISTHFLAPVGCVLSLDALKETKKLNKSPCMLINHLSLLER